jgi:hypothetical protein
MWWEKAKQGADRDMSEKIRRHAQTMTENKSGAHMRSEFSPYGTYNRGQS